jgi:sphingomyelin phosphodiesterase
MEVLRWMMLLGMILMILSLNVVNVNLNVYAKPVILEQLQAQGVIQQSYKGLLENITCDMCQDVAKYIAPLVTAGISKDIIETLAFTYCYVERVDCNSSASCYTLCKGIVDEYGSLVIDLLADSYLTPSEVCYAIDLCPAPTPTPVEPGVPVPSNLSDSSGQKHWSFWNLTSGTGTFVHISDIHLDELYTTGSNTQCGEPLCCRAANGPGSGNNSAGLYGDYNCDTPEILLTSVIEFIQKLAPDFIIYTGDDPAHDIWEQSKDKNVASMATVMAKLTQAFPTTPVFTAVGNHEAFPVDQFFGPGTDSWLYYNLSRAWANSLANDAFPTINYGGYYQNLIRPGLRVISLNTNVYATGDFYTKYQNMTDFSSQFSWLMDVLDQCEKRIEKAIIIGHSEPRHWFGIFANQYSMIVANYSHVILNMFFGHTHEASVSIFHSNSTTYEPLVISYVGGSITPYTYLNPGFRVYNYNREQYTNMSYLVEDYTQYWIDLPTANANKQIDWSQKQLQATVNYSLPDLSPKSWTNLAISFQNTQNQAAYNAYMTAYYKGAILPADPWEAIQSLGCDLMTVTDSEYTICMQSINATSLIFIHQDRCDPTISTNPSTESNSIHPIITPPRPIPYPPKPSIQIM